MESHFTYCKIIRIKPFCLIVIGVIGICFQYLTQI